MRWRFALGVGDAVEPGHALARSAGDRARTGRSGRPRRRGPTCDPPCRPSRRRPCCGRGRCGGRTGPRRHAPGASRTRSRAARCAAKAEPCTSAASGVPVADAHRRRPTRTRTPRVLTRLARCEPSRNTTMCSTTGARLGRAAAARPGPADAASAAASAKRGHREHAAKLPSRLHRHGVELDRPAAHGGAAARGASREPSRLEVNSTLRWRGRPRSEMVREPPSIFTRSLPPSGQPAADQRRSACPRKRPPGRGAAPGRADHEPAPGARSRSGASSSCENRTKLRSRSSNGISRSLPRGRLAIAGPVDRGHPELVAEPGPPAEAGAHRAVPRSSGGPVAAALETGEPVWRTSTS